MQSSDAAKLREKWGDKPCDHPKFEKEYYLGADTMDKVCTTCGEVFTKAEIVTLKAKRAKD